MRTFTAITNTNGVLGTNQDRFVVTASRKGIARAAQHQGIWHAPRHSVAGRWYRALKRRVNPVVTVAVRGDKQMCLPRGPQCLPSSARI
jgi:hypothetical protein